MLFHRALSRHLARTTPKKLANYITIIRYTCEYIDKP